MNADHLSHMPSSASDLDDFPSPISLSQLPQMQLTRPDSCQPSRDADPKPPSTHIPRPPNPFMLFRSYMLKKKTIPESVEKRQQQLSKVIGQCWNLLPPEEKQPWIDEAARLRREHQLMYPGYKFTPAAKGSARKGRCKDAKPGEDNDGIRELREKYTRILGPAAPSSREKKPKQEDHSLSRNPDTLYDVPLFSVASSPSSSSPSSVSSPSGSFVEGAIIAPPSAFPNMSYSHIRDSDYGSLAFEGTFMNDHPFPSVPPSTCSSPADIQFMSPNLSYDATINAFLPSFTEPPSPSSDPTLSAQWINSELAPAFDIYSHTPDPRPSFTFTSLNDVGDSFKPPPFLSPLVPSATDIAEGLGLIQQPPLENLPPKPDLLFSESHSHDYPESSLRLFPTSFFAEDGGSMNLGSWNFPSALESSPL